MRTYYQIIDNQTGLLKSSKVFTLEQLHDEAVRIAEMAYDEMEEHDEPDDTEFLERVRKETSAAEVCENLSILDYDVEILTIEEIKLIILNHLRWEVQDVNVPDGDCTWLFRVEYYIDRDLCYEDYFQQNPDDTECYNAFRSALYDGSLGDQIDELIAKLVFGEDE